MSFYIRRCIILTTAGGHTTPLRRRSDIGAEATALVLVDSHNNVAPLFSLAPRHTVSSATSRKVGPFPIVQRYRDGVRTRFFAPANLRAASESPAYMALVQHYITERYTLRYSGGLVPPTWCMPWSRAHGIYVSPRVIGQPRQAAQAV